MTTALAAPLPWWSWRRWLRRTPTPVEARLVSEAAHKAGADFAQDWPVEPGYSVEQAMSAFAAIPWVYICATAVAQDVARVPVRVYRGRRKGAEALPDNHPAVRLIMQPNSQTSYGQATRQRVVDRLLTGCSYRRVLGVGRTPTGTLRMHPERVRAVVADNTLIDHWIYRWMSESRLSVDEVLWDHGPSWEDGPIGTYGQGMIRALHNAIVADEATWARQAEAQRRGRPDAIVSPNQDDGTIWDDKQTAAMKRTIQKVFDDSHGGVVVLGERLKMDMLSWRPDQMSAGTIHADVKAMVLSAAGVTPARVGPSDDPAAEMLWYYQNTVMPLAAEFAEADTRLVERIDSHLWVEHDWSEIAALQDDRTKRQTRVKNWVELGYDTVTAGELEGFFGLPEPTNAPLSTPGSKPMDGENQKVNVKPKAKAPPPEPEAEEDAEELENAARWLVAQPDDNRDAEALAMLLTQDHEESP